MGYQESILVCENKKDFRKLCKALNSAQPQLDDYVSIFAIGRLKAELRLINPFCPDSINIVPAGTYFVWWGGERHPFQSGFRMDKDERKIFNPCTSSWNCIFCDYIADIGELLRDIDLNDKKGVCQENATVCLFELPYGDSIRDEYIKEIR